MYFMLYFLILSTGAIKLDLKPNVTKRNDMVTDFLRTSHPSMNTTIREQ